MKFIKKEKLNPSIWMIIILLIFATNCHKEKKTNKVLKNDIIKFDKNRFDFTEISDTIDLFEFEAKFTNVSGFPITIQSAKTNDGGSMARTNKRRLLNQEMGILKFTQDMKLKNRFNKSVIIRGLVLNQRKEEFQKIITLKGRKKSSGRLRKITPLRKF